MRSGRIYGLFEVYGLELEYMIVDRDSLAIKSIVDKLIIKKLGEIASDVDNGRVSWSNELTAHVLELKTTVPSPTIEDLSEAFLANIHEINNILASENAMLLPTAAHPTVDPFKETKLWEHDYNEVYDIYNTIFDCRGHGWSNLQSFHINLPFQHDIDFERLHAAVRLILPIIPAISASSPILDGKFTGYIDGRMETYLHNQERIPTIMGKLIPERVFNEVDYHKVIYEPIIRDIRPFDKNKVMDHHFLNSRGAIARFDRGAIEIRVIDVQECPLADMAICSIIVELLKSLVSEKHSSLADQKSWHEDDLRNIFNLVIRDGSEAIISNTTFLKIFGVDMKEMSVRELWKSIFTEVGKDMPARLKAPIEHILNKGNLSERILKRTGKEPEREKIFSTYKEMALCLQENRQLE